MKILHVITRSEWGGAQKVVYMLAKAQNEAGYRVTVMCGEEGRLVNALRTAGIKVLLNQYLKRSLGLWDWRAYNALKRECQNDYDLIHAHSSKAGVLARLVGRSNKLPICFTVHGFGITREHAFWKQVIYNFLEKVLARLTDAIVFVSYSDEECARKKGWLKHAKLTAVISNGVLSQTGYNDMGRREIGRGVLGIEQKAFVIGNLARVVWVKNPDFWLEVALKFLRKHPESYFVWYGGGERLKEFQNRVSKLPERTHILFPGEVEDVEQALQVMDILFLSSRSEGLPLAVLEAMSRNKAVVIPRLPGLQEIVKNIQEGECGITFPTGNVEAAISAMESLIDPLERKKIGAAAYLKFEQKYTEKCMIEGYEELYNKVLNRKESVSCGY